ncbi:Pre-mRNA-splicing factor 38A like [Actinidia chinensis var. chinensis]|uniref:Pre-mRNA-splicing factor 38A like n=1 Tax=Actinidia chinensis var. chinensis TaxID=1590841 RepID=A0A2R6RPE3_ACTCC|nr:Pre-mRNA-splicing factor 38A like [Actinidia chinensis var. chinensis]
MVWACFANCFSVLEYGCTYLCYKLPTLKRKHRRHKRDIEEFITSSTEDDEMEAEDKSFSYHMPRRSRRDYKGDHLRRSLRPKSHRVQVGIRGDSTYVSKRNSIKNGHHGRSVHDIRVTQTSKFARKGGSYKGSTHRARRK